MDAIAEPHGQHRVRRAPESSDPDPGYQLEVGGTRSAFTVRFVEVSGTALIKRLRPPSPPQSLVVPAQTVNVGAARHWRLRSVSAPD